MTRPLNAIFLFLMGGKMKKETEYLLKYIKNDTYQKVISKDISLLSNLGNDRRDIELNIRYLLKLGVSNIDYIVLERMDDLFLSHIAFEKKIDDLLCRYSKEELVSFLENS